jgi:hypothetical protein
MHHFSCSVKVRTLRADLQTIVSFFNEDEGITDAYFGEAGHESLEAVRLEVCFQKQMIFTQAVRADCSHLHSLRSVRPG